MKMIGHYNEFIQFDVGKFFGYFLPPFINHDAGMIWNHFIVDDFTQ
jgi:hypothetical protein